MGLQEASAVAGQSHSGTQKPHRCSHSTQSHQGFLSNKLGVVGGTNVMPCNELEEVNSVYSSQAIHSQHHSPPPRPRPLAVVYAKQYKNQRQTSSSLMIRRYSTTQTYRRGSSLVDRWHRLVCVQQAGQWVVPFTFKYRRGASRYVWSNVFLEKGKAYLRNNQSKA